MKVQSSRSHAIFTLTVEAKVGENVVSVLSYISLIWQVQDRVKVKKLKT